MRQKRIIYRSFRAAKVLSFALFSGQTNLRIVSLPPHPVVPHITDSIQEWVMNQAKVPVDGDGVEPQVCVIEVSWLGFYTLCGLNWV